MTYKNYIIKYTVKDKNGAELKSGKMRAKKKLNEFEAQAKFEDWLKKKYPNFGQLIVHDCSEESAFNDLFKDIFGNNNPFKF